MHNHRKYWQAFVVVGLLLLCFSCKKEAEKTAIVQQPAVQTESKPYHWLYFTSGTDRVLLKKVQRVAEIPPVRFIPWTKAVRVVDIGYDKEPLFLINKCGIYTWDDCIPNAPFAAQHQLFSLASAGGLYRVNDGYSVRIHQNSIFSEKKALKNTHFLLRRENGSNVYTPEAEPSALDLPKEAQCTALQQVNNTWYACFKCDDGKSVSFYYRSCDDFADLTKKDAVQYVSTVSKEAFRNACKPNSYRLLPAILKNMADSIENTEPVYIRLFSHDSAHTTFFLKSGSENANGTINAHAIFSKNENQEPFAALLLPDGAFFMNSGETGVKLLHLPALPDNFVYTAFFIKDNKIIAAWEEQDFFQVGRSGLFTASLDELL